MFAEFEASGRHPADATPAELLRLAEADLQRAVPAIAKDARLSALVEEAVRQVGSRHALHLADCRELTFLADQSVDLVVTSPPYWTLKEYRDTAGQMGHIADYDEFLDQLDCVWSEVLRLLVPGGRLVIVVGDVCLPRRRVGRHLVMPLHASITERCRRLGFDNLNPIIWHKIANAQLEVAGATSFLGKPYEPNSVIKNDIEFILFQRKPGGYRSPDLAAKLLSIIPEPRHREWFSQLWTIPGASTRDHPAPFPLPLAERLIRMFSFVGDTVLDPFCGTGTTSVAAARWGRHSLGVEVVPEYYDHAVARLRAATAQGSLFAAAG